MSKATMCVMKHLGKNSPIHAFRAEMQGDVDELIAGGMDRDEAWVQVIDAKLTDLRAEVARIEGVAADAYAKTPSGRKAAEAQAAEARQMVEPPPAKDAESTKAIAEVAAEPIAARTEDGEMASGSKPAAAGSESTVVGEAAAGTISDIGEKIGGARKDTSVSGGKGRRRTTDDARPAWARRFQVSQIVTPPGMIGEAKNAGSWVILDSKLLDWTKQPRQVGNETYATKEEAEAFIPIAAVSLKHRALSTRDGKYEIWRDISDRKRVKVVDKEFSTRDEALAYMAANATDIIETNTTFGEADMPLPPDRARSGPTRRDGNVKGEDFKETFGLRAVEFGNWNNQDDRQSLMNDAWDGLLDLADVLGIPPKALGLNGDLALAFGARGHGLQGARAHYELDRAVINLTKEKGAGSLAHEWFHALDHYFGRQDGKAPATWQVGPDGTRTLKAGDAEQDFASSGFQRNNSGVRPEVRAAYETLLKTMFKKAEGYVEDMAKVDKFTGQAREELARALDKLRFGLSEQLDPTIWKRNNKPAPAELLGEFDTIAAKMLAGESLSTDWRWVEKNSSKAAKGRATANRWTNDALEQLSAIYKATRGRSGFTTDRDGVLDQLRGHMERYSQRLKMLADAQAGTEKTKQVPTEFAMNAKELDQGRGTDYWTTPHEMAARAFQGYVEDKIAERGGVSRFLNYGPENAGILTPWGFKRPFPAGAERVEINKAFDAFVAELKTETTDKGVALFSRSEEPLRKLAELAKTPTNANETVTVAAVSPSQAALLAAEGIAVKETTQHTADLYAVRHALNRHGDEAVEKARGQLALSADDIARVAEVVGAPDAYAVGPKTKRGDDLVGYIKRMPDGAILYIEELRTGKNRLAMLSMRKYPGAKDFASIAQSLLSNARSDTGDVRIVYPQQGDAQAFSRSGIDESPQVTVEHDESGFPLFISDKVRLEFPQVTARLDVIEQDGEKVVNYPIMSPVGFEVLGHVELLVKDGRAIALLDIEVNKDARKRGVARSAVEAILAGTDGNLNISNIVTEARGFWSKLGVPEQNLPDGHAYEGTINANSFRQGLGADASGARAGAVEAESGARGAGAQEDGGPDAGAEGGVGSASEPAQGEGRDRGGAQRRQAVEALVARVTARWKNAPEVVVVASMADPLVPRAVRQANTAQLSQGAQGNPEGFFHDGKVYLVAPQLGGDADVVRVLFHEALGHYGLRGTFGPELGTILDRLAVLNAGKVRAKAKQYGLDYDKPSDRRMAAEEVLAEMAQKAPNIGWAKKAVAAIRTWLREHVPGFRKMAMSDEEIVRSFILPARAFVQRGEDVQAAAASSGGISRRDLLLAAAATAASNESKAGTTLGKASPIPTAVLTQTMTPQIVKLLRAGQAGGTTNIQGAKAILEAMQEIAKSGPVELRGLASQIAGLLPKEGAMLTVDDRRRMNAHGAVTWGAGGPHMQLFNAEGHAGLSYGTFMHEALHLAVLARYKTLASGVVRGNDAKLNVGTPAAAKALEQLRKLWDEFEAAAAKNPPKDDKTKLAVQEAMSTPDEFFVRALTDAGLQAYMAQIEYEGRSMLERFKDWVTGLFFKSGVRPSWLDAALLASQELVAGMPQDAADYARLRASERLSARRETAFSRSKLADAVVNFNQEGVRNAFLDAVTTHGKTNLWGRTVGTQYHKAQTHPTTFGRVFNAVQDYIKDTSVFANRAADLAPSLLPKLDTAADLMRDGPWRHGADPKDTAKAGEAIFQGTLNKELYDDATLRSRFGLTPKQVELYREFRAAVDQSLEGLGKTEILRIAGAAGRSLRAEVLAAPSLDDAAEILTAAVAGDPAAAQQIQEKVARVTQLQDEGYAPLMRFGKHTLHVTGPGGSTEFFGMYETVRDANRAARQLRADPEMAKFTFTQGVMSEEGHKLFNGLTMDSLELFADATGNADNPVYQAYLKLAVANRSALKRMIERQGIKGYSDDVARVLASFVTSNARMSAGHLHLADAKKAAEAIPKEQGDLRDDAINLVEYVTTPTEEAAAVRGLLFTSFIGGSVASALVNMTQPITMTLPYLTQFGGAAKAGKRLTAAMAMVASGKGMDAELAAALKRAEDDGIVSPQEIHHLQAQAMNTLGQNPVLKKAAFVWGAMFSLAEQFNRRVSFVAAYETAKQQGIDDPFAFAEKAVIETQGLYNKGNKANLARGAVGATVMTFKQFSTHYLEFLVRMWKSGPEGKKAVAVALALLMLMGGAGGLPFADDLDDLIDTLGQAMGYDMNSKRWKRQFVAQTLGLGDAAADVATRGLTALPGFPLDLSLRMGMGNLLPATGLFLRSNTDTARQLLEVAGAAGGLAANVKDGVTKAMGGDLAGGAMNAMPVAVQNIAKAIQMGQTGEYRNAKGAKVMDVDAFDAAMKGIGFQPAQVARESGRVGEAMRSIQLAKNVEGEIAGRWAQAMVDQDAEGVAAAKKQLADWNATNPSAPIKITLPQVLARVKALRQSRADRTVKAAPKEMRATVKESLS